MATNERDNYIRIIEAQPSINGRFTRIRRIDQRAGMGNFSIVFKAFDSETKQDVALKFYNPLCRGDGYRKKCFEREANVLEKLKGQKDVLQLVQPLGYFTRPVVDVGTGITTNEDLAFIATELATSNMWHYIYSDGVVAGKNLKYFRIMVRAVQRVHGNGICHRDIKPENYFIIGKDNIHLGDYGTAKSLDGTMPPLLEDYRYWRGDKRYTAPEQCANIAEKPEIVYIGDIYSLGAILFEMFTKQLLSPIIFDSDFHQSLSEHFDHVPLERREIMIRQLIPDIARTRKLPNISDYNKDVPISIRSRLEALYHGLTCLDYTRRTRDFKQIFREINLWETILTKEKDYIRMIQLRRKWFDNRKKNLEEKLLKK